LNRILSKICAILYKYIKKNYIRTLDEIYSKLGCTKQDISYWRKNPCSTQALCRKSKIAVILKASNIFDLSDDEKEALANRAGLSFCEHKNGLAEIIKQYKGKYCDLLNEAAVSERMFQYYIAGKEPTKQALLAIAISLRLPLDDIEKLLREYGYCLSKSLPNDAVVLWFLKDRNKHGSMLLSSINNVLDDLDLPLLMTKLIDRGY
jgi:hypothetical protein